MAALPKIFKFLRTIFGPAVLVPFIGSGCATSANAPTQWYDWDASWSRSDLAHVSMQRSLVIPRKPVSAKVAKERKSKAVKRVAKRFRPRVQVKQVARSGQRSDSSSESQGSVHYEAMASMQTPQASHAETPGTKRRTPSASEPRASRTMPERTKEARDLGLGNGSHASEFLSAAIRLIGIKDGFLKKSFLRHLLSVSAVDLSLKAPQNAYAGVVFEHFQAQGHQVLSPKPGDLIFFATSGRDGRAAEDYFSTAAVLEAIEANGSYRCIGWVLGEVRRFKMDPRRPHLRRDERTGERINDVIRERSMGDGHRQPALAGKLLLGFLRL